MIAAAVGRDAGQLVLDDRADVGLHAVGPGPELGGHGMGTEPGRDDVQRPFASQPVGDLDEAQLGLEVQPVAGLRFHGRHAVAEHLVEPPAAVGQQARFRCGPRRCHRGEDPSPGLEDLEV